MEAPLSGRYMNTKECNQCKIYLSLDKFRTRTQYGKPYMVAKCKRCEYENNQAQCDRERRKETERRRFSNPERRERKNDLQRRWREKNIEKNRNYHKKNIKKNVDELTDSYIGRMIFHVKCGIPVPADLIKLKRLSLICKRTLKTKLNGSH